LSSCRFISATRLSTTSTNVWRKRPESAVLGRIRRRQNPQRRLKKKPQNERLVAR